MKSHADPWQIIHYVFCKVFCPCDKHHKRVTRIATYRFKDVEFTAEGDTMSLVIKDTDVPGTVTVSIAFVNSKGRPAKVDGVPTWAASDPTVIDSVTPSADGMSATLHITDTIGVSQLTVNADVDLGSGTNNKDFIDTISVIPGEAVAATFTFGAVTPDAPPVSLADEYDSDALFDAAALAYTGADRVNKNGIEVHPGTLPATEFYSHSATGKVNKTPPTD